MQKADGAQKMTVESIYHLSPIYLPKQKKSLFKSSFLITSVQHRSKTVTQQGLMLTDSDGDSAEREVVE